MRLEIIIIEGGQCAFGCSSDPMVVHAALVQKLPMALLPYMVVSSGTCTFFEKKMH
jgi:hypothetical protein